MRNAVVIDPKDNVAVAIEPLAAGETAFISAQGEPGPSLPVTEDIPLFHKLALEPIPRGHAVVKYGEYIGVATKDIAPGDWVHVHNVESTDAQKDQADVEEEVSEIEAAVESGEE